MSVSAEESRLRLFEWDWHNHQEPCGNVVKRRHTVAAVIGQCISFHLLHLWYESEQYVWAVADSLLYRTEGEKNYGKDKDVAAVSWNLAFSQDGDMCFIQPPAGVFWDLLPDGSEKQSN